MTLIIDVRGLHANSRQLAMAVKAIEAEKVVLVPTETGYCFVGKAGSALVHKLFLDLRAAHPKNKPFSLLCANLAQVSEFSSLGTEAYRMAKKLLPGPVTLVLGFSRNTPRYAGFEKQKTVGIRISENEIARGLVEACGQPLLITSVTATEELNTNYYDDGSEDDDAWWAWAPQISEHFYKKFDVAFSCDEAVPLRMSTILDLTTSPPQLIRDGGWDIQGIGFLET